MFPFRHQKKTCSRLLDFAAHAWLFTSRAYPYLMHIPLYRNCLTDTPACISPHQWGSCAGATAPCSAHCPRTGRLRQDGVPGPVCTHMARLPWWSTWKCFASAPEMPMRMRCPCRKNAIGVEAASQLQLLHHAPCTSLPSRQHRRGRVQRADGMHIRTHAEVPRVFCYV